VPDAASVSGADADTGSGIDAGIDSAVPTPPPDYIWYVLDETSGATAHDSSPHHFDITNLSGVTWSAGANFTGTGGGGSTTVTGAYRVPPITFTAWLTPGARTDGTSLEYAYEPYPPNALGDDIPSEGGYGVGLNVWTDGEGGSALAADSVDTCTVGSLCACNSTQNAETADAGIDGGPSCTRPTDCHQGFVAGQEYFVVVTVAPSPDGGTTAAQVYVNGAIFDQTTAGVPPANATPPLYLGKHNEDTSYGTKRIFDGRIRDVRVYQRQLGASEVAQLYANGRTLHAPVEADAGPEDAATD
jgi:hypothetical protein